ncbi:MAG: hypothetical protein IKB05_02760 [Alphaproteobacteria bacterium]|nr:hypothetical protein [Alphaproteobacteria bacterium]
MRKIIWAFSLCLVVMPSRAATLQGYGTVERCFVVPDRTIPTCDGADYVYFETYCYVVELGCNIRVKTEAVLSPMKTKFAQIHDEITEPAIKYGNNVFCKMTYPYEGLYVTLFSFNDWGDLAADLECASLYLDNAYDCYQNRDGDDCEVEYYYGSFYTTEYQELFLSALFATEMPSEIPCTIGISNLMVSTGDAFQLYAEKYTEPSLVVQYNDEKCYVKLESGVGNLNINFNGEIYHAVE